MNKSENEWVSEINKKPEIPIPIHNQYKNKYKFTTLTVKLMFNLVCHGCRICRRTLVDRNVVYYMESKAKKKTQKENTRTCLGIMGIRENIIQIANKHHSGTQHQLHNGYLVSHVTFTLHSSWHLFHSNIFVLLLLLLFFRYHYIGLSIKIMI